MSAPDKPDLDRSWSAAEKVLAEEEDRLATLSDEEFEREMRSAPDPARVPTAGELLAGAGQSSRITLRPARPNRIPLVWLIAAAIGMAGIVYILQRRETVASGHHESPALRQAAQLRQDAVQACERALWLLCEEKLDEAERIDPAGERDTLVQSTRKAAHDGLHPDDNGEDKPRP
jgi:hypothetical protein